MFLLKRSEEYFANSASGSSRGVGESLYKRSSREAEELIYRACRNIEKIYGNYDEEKCRQKVEELQKYILANLPAIVFDDLCDIRKIRDADQDRDIRIDLALYIHPNIKKLIIKHFIEAPAVNVECTFWAMHASKLHNLVVLDLNLSCTDEILEIVAENCRKLVYIDIVSRVEAMHIKDWDVNHFNALKLKYCVSDVGLEYLCKCKLLRKIRMNRMFRSHFGGGLVTLGGIRKLLKSLPLLEHVTFEDMGMVLADEMEDVEQLSLIYLSDFHPRPAHLDIVSRMCPDLKQLCLRFPSTSTSPNEAEILHALASCSLKVSELQLLGFSFSPELALVIETKGWLLNSLAIENLGHITSGTIQLIGRSCPNLINLHLSEEQSPGEIFSWVNTENFHINPAKAIFGNLHYLTLTGKTWIPSDILPLCLTSAKKLKTLKIYSMYGQGSLDASMGRIISVNPLKNLEVVYLLARSKLTICTLHYFFNNCPRLMELFFLKTGYLTQEHVDVLCTKMIKHNFAVYRR